MQGLGYGAGVRRRAASPRRGRQHGAAQRGIAAPRVSSQAEEVLLPVPLLQGDSPIRHTEPLCSGTDGPRRPHPHLHWDNALGQAGVERGPTIRSIWVVWLSRMNPLASIPSGSPLRLSPRARLAAGGSGMGTYHLEVPVELGVLPHVPQEAGGGSGGLLVVRAGKGTGCSEVLGSTEHGTAPTCPRRPPQRGPEGLGA